MCAGVSKSGSPISRWTTSRPFASSARARTSTSNAVSVPSRAILWESRMVGLGAEGTTSRRSYRGSPGPPRAAHEVGQHGDETRRVVERGRALEAEAQRARGLFRLDVDVEEHLGVVGHEADGGGQHAAGARLR